MREITVNENDASQRLDKFMHKYFKSRLPSSLIYKYIRKKRVKVNGKGTTVDYVLAKGDVLSLYINDENFTENGTESKLLRHINGRVNVVYEDLHILIADKERGLVSHEDNEGSVDTLINRIKAYLIAKGEYDPNAEHSFAPALCHRLDRNTSGLVITAKTAVGLREMNEIIKRRMLNKLYYALVIGNVSPACAELRGFLTKDNATNKVTITESPRRGASEIITRYKTIKRGNISGEKVTLLEVELVTGKTHQIRAHLASVGYPIVGDGKYGRMSQSAKISGLQGQALHAQRITFSNSFSDYTLGYLCNKEIISSSCEFLHLIP